MLNRRQKRIFFFFVVLYFSVGIGIAQQAETAIDVLTLERAIANAVESSRPLKIAALETKKIENRIAATQTRRRPSSNFYFLGAQTLTDMNFTFRQGQFGQFPSTGPVPSQDTQVGTPPRLIGLAVLQVDQPLSQLKKINLSLLAQGQEIEANQQKIRQQRQELIAQIRQVYYQIIQQESALDASNEAFRQYAELDRYVTTALAQQAALKLESLEVKALIAREEYNRLTIRNAIDEQKEVLNRLMGRDLRTPFRVERIAEATPLELELAVAQATALSQRPEIKQAEIRTKQADYDRLLKKSENRPDLSLVFRYISPIHTETLPKNILAVGFTFSWDPWDWGRKKYELNEKENTLEQTKESLAEIKNQILAEVSQRHRRLEVARAAFRVIEIEQESSREKVRVLQQQYAAQTVLLKDVLQAEVSQAAVNLRYQQALMTFWSARADFEKSIGAE